MAFKPLKPKPRTINIVLMNGGVGDHIGSLVTVNYIIMNYPWITPLVWVPDFLLELSKHLIPKAIINDYSNMPGNYNRNLPTKTTEWDGHVSPMKIHSLDYAFLKLCDENPSIQYKNYLQIKKDIINTARFNLPKDYVVITTGYTVSVREFRAEYVNKIAGYIKSKNLTPVFLGQTATKTGAQHVIKGKFDKRVNLEAGVNLIDKTTLLESAGVIANAKAIVGVDNGLLHLAGCTETPIVGGFTTVSPNIRMPVRHNVLGWNYYPVVPNESLSCRFIQEKSNFLYDYDYTKCCQKIKSDCYLECTKLTAEKFITELDKIL